MLLGCLDCLSCLSIIIANKIKCLPNITGPAAAAAATATATTLSSPCAFCQSSTSFCCGSRVRPPGTLSWLLSSVSWPFSGPLCSLGCVGALPAFAIFSECVRGRSSGLSRALLRLFQVVFALYLNPFIMLEQLQE